VHLGKYLKAAFNYHWNLLWFGAGTFVALLSGYGEVFLPLVMAGELTYLGLLGTHPKFQSYVDAQAAKSAREQGSENAEQAILRIYKTLPKRSLDRFNALRARCLELRQIAQELKSPGSANSSVTFDSVQVAGLDRLLWIFLRLLYTEFSLDRFLHQTSEEAIQADINRLQANLQKLGPANDDLQREKMRKTIEDNLQTSRDRLTNLQRARGNFDLVHLEIDRLENKITSLCEIAVNRQEPDFITGQVDQVATSMLETEKTMNELQFVTGFSETEQAVPELLERPPAIVQQR
jgi:hypothetical protein